MRGVAIFISVLVLLTSCKDGKDYSPEIDFGGVAYVKVIVQDDLDSVRMDINHGSYYPIQSCLIHRFTLTERRVCEASYSITRPELVWFEFRDTVFTSYMRPGDTLVARVGLDEAGDDNRKISFQMDDPIFAFLQNERSEFGCFYTQSPLAIMAFNTQPETERQFEDAIKKIDQARQERLKFLEKNWDILPEWFCDLYENEISYFSENMKFYQYYYLKNRSLGSILMPCDVKIYNPEAVLSPLYWRFISDYFLLSDSVDYRLIGPPRLMAYYSKASHNINSLLKGKILEYFNAYFLYDLYYGADTRKELQLVDSFRIATDFRLTSLQESYIDDRKSQSLKKIEKLEDENRLKPGSEAPYFYLKDSAGVFHTLSDYRGRLIYLHFWATWCGPCLEEIPSLNKLAENLSGKPIEIINICLDDEYEKWETIIENEKLKGINLICVGSWAADLQEKYSVRGIPHYAIIDTDGLIISENCERPDKVYERLLTLIQQ